MNLLVNNTNTNRNIKIMLTKFSLSEQVTYVRSQIKSQLVAI